MAETDHPLAWVLSFDVGGPFAPGRHHDRVYPRYMLPANLTVPVLNDLPLIAGSRPKEESLQVADQPDELDVLGAQLHDDDVDLFKMESPLVVEGQEIMKTRPMLSPSRLFNLSVKQVLGRLKIRVKMLKFLCHRMLTRMMWRKQAKVADLQRFRIVNLPVAIPLTSRRESHVVEAAATLYSKWHGLQIPIAKVHPDRAKEFISTRWKEWRNGRRVPWPQHLVTSPHKMAGLSS